MAVCERSTAILWGVALLLIIIGSIGSVRNSGKDEDTFSSHIHLNNLIGHLQSLTNSAGMIGNRAIGTDNGYPTSVSYVAGRLYTETGYNITLQNFTYPGTIVNNKPILNVLTPTGQPTWIYGTDYTGVGGNIFPGQIRNVTYSLGCNLATDFVRFKAGDYLLEDTSTGLCSTSVRFQNALAMGAGALILFDSARFMPPRQIPCASTMCLVPLFYLSQAKGILVTGWLANQQIVEFRLECGFSDVTLTLTNIIAETPWGDANNVIMQGSHLDSVPAGLGINDNGSGSSANLEMALQFWKRYRHDSTYKIRFAWWTAEEVGLVGSYYYVNSLSTEEKNKIVVYMNYDMIASNNFYRGIYNGSGASDPNLRPAGAVIQGMLTSYFIKKGINTKPTGNDIGERSDHAAFANNGIPYGGIFTGAEVYKNASDQLLFGGLANAPFDPCYHSYCDNLDNLNTESFISNAAAAADILQDLWQTKNLRQFLTNGVQLTNTEYVKNNPKAKMPDIWSPEHIDTIDNTCKH